MTSEPFVQVPVRWLVELTPDELAVAIAIASHADRRGDAWPSSRRLSQLTGLSRPTIRKAISRLVEQQILTVTQRQRTDGGHTSHLYRIHRPSEGDPQPPSPGQETDQPWQAGYPGDGSRLSQGVENAEPGAWQSRCHHEPDPEEPDPREPQGGNLCVSARGRAQEAADAAPTHRRPRRGDVSVPELPADLQWARAEIEAFWVAKRGSRSAAAATHLWEQLRAIAEAGGPQAALEQLQTGAAKRWASIDVHAWRHYTRRSRPGGGSQKLPLDERIRQSAAFLESLNLNPIPEDKPLWP